MRKIAFNHHWFIIILLGAAVLIAGLIGSPGFRQLLFSPSNPGTIVFEDDLDKGAPNLKAAAQITGNPAFTEFGLAVVPDSSFAVRFKGKLPPQESPFVRVWLPNGAAGNATLQFKVGSQEETLALRGNYTGYLVAPATLIPSEIEQTYEITLSAALPAGAQQPLFVLDRMEVGHRIIPTGSFASGFWGVIVCALLPWVVFEILASHWNRNNALKAAAGFTLILCTVALLSEASHQVLGYIALGMLLAIAVWLLYNTDVPRIRLRYEWIFVAGLAGIALLMRWRWLTLLQPSPLPLDAQHYFQMAVNMSWPYDTETREPFLMWMIWLAHRLMAPSELAQRLATLGLAIGEAIALYWLSRQFVRIRLAWIPVVLMAFNPAMASNAVLGMREEALPLGWLLFLIGAVQAWKRAEGPRPHILMGIGAAVAIMTRLNAAAFLVPVYGIAWAVKRWSFKYVAITGILSAAVILPHMINHTVVYGDPFKSMNIYHVSEPGEFKPQATKEDGSVISRMFKRGEFLSKTASGTWNMLVGKSARESLVRLNAVPATDDLYLPASLSPQSVLLKEKPRALEVGVFLLYLVGLVVLAFRRGGWIVLATIFLFVVPISYILEVPGIREPRMLMNHAPLMLLAAGIGFSFLIGLTTRFVPAMNNQKTPRYGRQRKQAIPAAQGAGSRQNPSQESRPRSGRTGKKGKSPR